MKKIIPIAIFLVGLWFQWSCGNGPAITYLSALESQTSTSGTVCTMELKVVNTSPEVLSLIHAVAKLEDNQGKELTFDFDHQTLANLASTQAIGSGTRVSMTLSLDFSGSGGTLPAQGLVTLIGIGKEVFTHFVGPISCTL